MEEHWPPLTRLERCALPASWSRIAEYESWRKERHRPSTYVHKWWARRLGSVFHHLLLAATDIRSSGQYRHLPLAGQVVYDPFAGSGTSLVEAAKLGARVVGRDINPIATLTQRQALQPWDLAELQRQHALIEACRNEVDALYVAEDGSPVLQYFWVALAHCTSCTAEVELFSNYIFAKHAYPRRFPRAHATCPRCHAVCIVTLGDSTRGACTSCGIDFNFDGPVPRGGRHFVCPEGHRSSVVEALGRTPPQRRMYAKAVRTADGQREYRTIDRFDLELYERASKLRADADSETLVVPGGTLEHGVNTAQALRWGYRTWADFFNDRQLYSLGRIAAAIRDLPGDGPEREALAAAFGKTVEHNNLFCSFKGEGTGPIRSIFHNHVLRPERCSVEGNPWGTGGGSGGFAEALNRLTAAHAYKSNPLDLAERDGRIVSARTSTAPINHRVVGSWKEFAATSGTAYVVTGDGGDTDLPTGSVSIVVTDPPYVDNVHYSELADFFHAWMRPIGPHLAYPTRDSTRDPREVQNTSPIEFRAMATRVWTECRRVLRDDGLVFFSFHQSRTAGWASLMASLSDAGLVVTAVRPIIAEVTTSLTKVAAAEPNRIDVIVACRKREQVSFAPRTPAQARIDVVRQLQKLHRSSLILGSGDVTSAVRAAVLAQGTRLRQANWDQLRVAADKEAAAAAAMWPN